MAAVDLGSAVGYLDLDKSGFDRGLKSAFSDFNIFLDKTANGKDKLVALESAMKSAGSSATKYFTLPIVSAGTAISAVGVKFDSTMSKVSAISGAIGSDLESLRDKAKEMGATTKYSASEAAEAFQYMAMAGWDTTSMLNGIDGIMNLAAADGLDLATTSDIVTDALTAFGLQAKDSAMFADVLATASSSANTNVAMMGETFKYVAPVAGALGYDVKDVAVAIGLMANSGIKASQAGTVLRGALTRMIKPTDDAKALMDEYNLSLTNSDGTMKSFDDAANMLRSSLGGLSEATQTQVAATIFGQEAMSGMLAIINASNEDFNKLTNAVENSEGAAKRMAKTMMDNLGGQLTVLKSSAEGAALSFYEAMLPALEKGVEFVQNFVNAINNMSDSQKRNIVTILGVTAALGPTLLIGSKVAGMIGSMHSAYTSLSIAANAMNGSTIALTASQTMLKNAMMAITSPIGLSITLLGSLYLMFKDVEGVSDALEISIVALASGFVAYRSALAIQPLIQGVTAAMAGQTLATNTSTAGIIANRIALSAQAMVQKVAAISTGAYNTVVAISTGNLGLATAAQTAFNVALTANPIGVVVVGIAALVAGLYALHKALSNVTDETEEYVAELDKQNEASKSLIDAVDASANAYDENANKAKASAEANKNLYEEIEMLAAIEEKSAGQKLLLNEKVKELNESVSGLGLSYDEETNKLNMNKSAVEEQIALQQAQLELSEGMKEQANIRQNLAEIDAKRAEVGAQLADIEIRLSQAETYGDRNAIVKEKEKALQVEQDLNVAYAEQSQRQTELNKIVEENAAIVESANAKKTDSEGEFADAVANTEYALDQSADAAKKRAEEMEKSLEKYTKAATNAFDKIKEEQSLTASEMTENLENNTAIVEQWSKDLATLSDRGINQGLLKNLRDAGPEAAKTVANLVSASDQELQKLNASFEGGSKIAIDALKREMGLPETVESGSEMIDNISKEMDANENLVKSSAEAIQKAKTEMDNKVVELKFESVGKNIVAGLADGIKNNSYLATNASRKVAQDVQTVFMQETDMHSPSKKFYAMGAYLDEGLANGIYDNSGLPTGEMDKVARAILQSGDIISEGLIERDIFTGQYIYSNTYDTIMKKIDLYYKERDKRVQMLDKGTDATLSAIDKEISATEQAYDIKMKLLEQEYLAKMAIIDEESARKIKALNAQIDAINAEKEAERRQEEEDEYNSQLGQKLEELQEAAGDEEKYARISEEIEKLKLQRQKVLRDQQREDEKNALRDKIEDVREAAQAEKDEIRDTYEENKWKLQQQKEDEIAYLQEMQVILKKDYEDRKALDEVHTKNMEIEQGKRTTTEKAELAKRELELKTSLNNNMLKLKKFGEDFEPIANSYGETFYNGFTSTESKVFSYLDEVRRKAKAAKAALDSYNDAKSSGSYSVSSFYSKALNVFAGADIYANARGVTTSTAAVSGNYNKNASVLAIDYDQLGKVIANNCKPSIEMNNSFVTPKPLSEREMKNEQEVLLRDLAFQYDL